MNTDGPIVGVLGGGQLGLMLGQASQQLGCRLRFLDPDPHAPAKQVGELLTGAYDDPALLDRLADGATAVTYEFENVPLSALEQLAERATIYPPPVALAAAQDRLAEKQLLAELNVPVPRFEAVNTRDELAEALERIGLPAVLKTRRLGYDGKGQAVLRSTADVNPAWASLGGSGGVMPPTTDAPALILEQHVNFEREVSLIAVQGADGEPRFYPLIENVHAGGILDHSVAPARDADALQAQAEQYAAALLTRLSYVGVLTIEFFVSGGGLLANEIAPRVHNSGHLTIEGALSSQFDNHLRAVLGRPLAPAKLLPGRAAAMANLLGELWLADGAVREPDWDSALAGASDVALELHLYGKREPRRGRKMGHITAVADSADAALLAVLAARDRL